MRAPNPALRRLLTDGSLPLSASSRGLLRWLAPLLATGVVERARSGVGERLLVRRLDTLQQFVDQRFPGGIHAPPPLTRAQAIARFRDSKLIAPDAPAVVLLRGMAGSVLHTPRGLIDLAAATARHGAFALAVRNLHRYRLHGSVATIENKESFFAAERLQAQGLTARSFVLGNGRLSGRLRAWLSPQTQANSSTEPIELWHCGDYDASGLSDYLALRADGANVSLFVPSNLEALLKRYGNASLTISSAELERLRLRFADPQVERVCALLSLTGCGLEQELLL